MKDMTLSKVGFSCIYLQVPIKLLVCFATGCVYIYYNRCKLSLQVHQQM